MAVMDDEGVSSRTDLASEECGDGGASVGRRGERVRDVKDLWMNVRTIVGNV